MCRYIVVKVKIDRNRRMEKLGGIGGGAAFSKAFLARGARESRITEPIRE
jgi:hypothetical protein